MLEAVTEAFNAANWNSAIERRLAADDIAQNLYHQMYPRLEIAEAAVQHKLPGEFIQELKQEKIECFENKPDETGVEALNFTVKDMETAERMVEQSGGMFHVVSTRNLDHYRDQFADALYSSDRHEGAAGLMESSLDDAIRLYNGDVSHVRRCPPAGEIRWSAPTGRCPRCSRREGKGITPGFAPTAERSDGRQRVGPTWKNGPAGCPGHAGARRKRRGRDQNNRLGIVGCQRRRSLTLQRADQAPAGESHDKRPKTRSRPQARPAKYGQTAITPGENQGRAAIRQANQLQPTPGDTIYLGKVGESLYSARNQNSL